MHQELFHFHLLFLIYGFHGVRPHGETCLCRFFSAFYHCFFTLYHISPQIATPFFKNYSPPAHALPARMWPQCSKIFADSLSFHQPNPNLRIQLVSVIVFLFAHKFTLSSHSETTFTSTALTPHSIKSALSSKWCWCESQSCILQASVFFYI